MWVPRPAWGCSGARRFARAPLLAGSGLRLRRWLATARAPAGVCGRAGSGLHALRLCKAGALA
eukprot:1531177-Alexandrium_andersonii.AAC.1